MSKRKKSNKTWVETFMGERKTWGNINPVTKVIPDKRKKPPKHKGRELGELA